MHAREERLKDDHHPRDVVLICIESVNGGSKVTNSGDIG